MTVEAKCQRRDIAGSRTERRQVNLEPGDPMVEVEPKRLRLDGLLHVGVRRRNEPHIHFQQLLATDAVNAAVLDSTQQAYLGLGRHVTQFIEEQRAAVGPLEDTRPGVHAGGRAFFDAEQLGLKQVPRQRGTVDRDERATRPG